jgi:hypothetical protein
VSVRDREPVDYCDVIVKTAKSIAFVPLFALDALSHRN